MFPILQMPYIEDMYMYVYIYNYNIYIYHITYVLKQAFPFWG